MDINHLIASRIRQLRDAQDLSLAALAERSGVSRSNISLIERGESSATATVLDKLSAALGVTVASLFERADEAPAPVSRAADQPVWTDPASGYVRRNLSPPADSRIQLVEVNFPPGQRVSYETAARDVDVQQQVWLIEGSMELTVGESHWMLSAGDCLAMHLDQPITYHNATDKPARYLVALVSQAHKPPRRNA
ncbi:MULTISPECIES: helix-turn-helix domain-containing protein [unclassified Massilia]|uniref:helix-turn-helix domain-containing protein n=1 Tax=unclassified Massilia TaxID=2609279 RepID=UPI001B80FC9B|nr:MULTISPECIES: XRE family transcriptional regulator [unclassified Massilia]MBQ5942510.1 helix-turn-helix transcriptional regulator [Massilia sp. AB1]MBQ5961663.1 helix-turn-helix transcriptional regulator [Massilia sp. ZL223]